MARSFDDEKISIDSVFGPLRVTVAGDALCLLWNADNGPQDGPGLVAANLPMIEQVALMKFEDGEAEADHAVRIAARDLED